MKATCNEIHSLGTKLFHYCWESDELINNSYAVLRYMWVVLGRGGKGVLVRGGRGNRNKKSVGNVMLVRHIAPLLEGMRPIVTCTGRHCELLLVLE